MVAGQLRDLWGSSDSTKAAIAGNGLLLESGVRPEGVSAQADERDEGGVRVHARRVGLNTTAHGVDIIAVMQMSSHYHAVVYDRLGTLSDFLRGFHGLMGKYGNARDGVENTKFWSAEDSETVEIGDMDTLVECVAYTLANPTKDFIVEDPETWMGVMTPPNNESTRLAAGSARSTSAPNVSSTRTGRRRRR